MFPCMFHFKGGKGILSGGTIAIMIDWRVALVVWGGFLILTILTRYVSLGSLWAGASFPFISWYCYPDPVIVALAFAFEGWICATSIGATSLRSRSLFMVMSATCWSNLPSSHAASA